MGGHHSGSDHESFASKFGHHDWGNHHFGSHNKSSARDFMKFAQHGTSKYTEPID